MNSENKIKIAVITSYGLDKAGTEKFLQNVAVLLPKDKYCVDYYYIDSDVNRVSKIKMNFLIDGGVTLIPYQVKKTVYKFRCIFQRESSFFKVYKSNYDAIITGSCGLPEDPLISIKDTPILQSIHYVSGVDDQYNISRVLHISNFSRKMWIDKGGDDSRSVMISHPINIPIYKKISIREKFEISEDTVVFGFHQRNNDYIFSPIPLKAYIRMETEKTAFIICGGSDKYREQAKSLNLKHCYFIPSTDNPDVIYSFLNSIDVYAHGRYDGELNSTALAEAMYFKLPIVTHPSDIYNGHLEVINGNGMVCEDISKYTEALVTLACDKKIREEMGNKSYEMFKIKYDERTQINNIEQIIDEVIRNPYQGRQNRFLKKLIRNLSIGTRRVIVSCLCK